MSLIRARNLVVVGFDAAEDHSRRAFNPGTWTYSKFHTCCRKSLLSTAYLPALTIKKTPLIEVSVPRPCVPLYALNMAMAFSILAILLTAIAPILIAVGVFVATLHSWIDRHLRSDAVMQDRLRLAISEGRITWTVVSDFSAFHRWPHVPLACAAAAGVAVAVAETVMFASRSSVQFLWYHSGSVVVVIALASPFVVAGLLPEFASSVHRPPADESRQHQFRIRSPNIAGRFSRSLGRSTSLTSRWACVREPMFRISAGKRCLGTQDMEMIPPWQDSSGSSIGSNTISTMSNTALTCSGMRWSSWNRPKAASGKTRQCVIRLNKLTI